MVITIFKKLYFYITSSIIAFARNLYLRHLGDGAHLIEDNYRQEALKLAQDLRKPYLAKNHNWKLAA